jgi:hypothetical protein
MAPHFKQIFKPQIQTGQRRRRIAPVDYGDRPEGRDNWKPAPSVYAKIDDSPGPRDTCKPPDDTRPQFAKIAKGPYLDDKRFYIDNRRPAPSKPLSPAAKRLLADYHRRRAFETAIANGSPVEWAGKELLRCGKTRAYEIEKELTDGAYWWFVHKFVEGLVNGTIGEGRRTERSDLADNFYVELAGGLGRWEQLRVTGGGRHKLLVKEVLTDMNIVDREVTGYGIVSRGFYERKDG